ncbi:MAG: hypothetical protein KC588_07245 [Nitrospira sp.]|nr:hypothetical protein [Nitrospira sp.]
MTARGNSTKPQSDLIRKAHAVLQNELESRTSLGTEVLSKDALPSLQDLETTVEPLRQQPGTLVDALMDVPKHPPESLAHIASRFPRLEGFQPEDNFQPIFLLKIPLPVSPGQTSHIDFTLINDDPTETAEHTLYTTNLVGMSGHRIPETYITVFPNSIRIPPGESVDGRIEIHVPTGTPQGSYGGLLQTEDITRLQAVIRLSVCS